MSICFFELLSSKWKIMFVLDSLFRVRLRFNVFYLTLTRLKQRAQLKLDNCKKNGNENKRRYYNVPNR